MNKEIAIEDLESMLSKFNKDNTSYVEWHNYANAVTIAKKALEKSSWIPVSERLPEENKEIIYCTKYNTQLGYYDGRGGWYSFSSQGYEKAYHEHYEVIAWQPKPEPYKEKNNE